MPQCYQSIVINAPIEQVWARVGDFHDFSWADGVIDCCEAVGELGGRDIGARRILNGVFHETLLECDETGHRIRYRIDHGPSPVSAQEVKNYIGTLQLKPVTLANATFVEWNSSWQSQTDAAANFCSPIDAALLKALAQQCEQA